MNQSRTLSNLIIEVEDLLTELDNEHGPHIDELRMRLARTIGSAKRAVARQRISVVTRIGQYARAADDYITGFPRLGFFTGILVGGMIVYVKGLGSSKS